MLKDIPLINRSFKDVNPLICGQETCDPGHSFGPAIRGYYLIHYVFSGKGFFERHGMTYHLAAGDLFLIRPGEVTYYQADRETPWHYGWIGFNGDAVANLLNETGFKDDQCVLSASNCANIFKTMQTARDRTFSPEIYLCSKLYDLLSELIEREKPQNCDSIADRHVRRAEDYIRANYASHLLISELAQKLNLDRRYLCRIFHQIKGVSPQSFLISVRLDQAAELLKSGSTVTATARSVGYEDIFTFSKMFKRRFAVSPLSYKNSV